MSLAGAGDASSRCCKHHYDIEINHILSKTWNTSLTASTRRFFLFLIRKKEDTDTDNARVAMPCKSAMNMAQKSAAVGLTPRDKVREEE